MCLAQYYSANYHVTWSFTLLSALFIVHKT